MTDPNTQLSFRLGPPGRQPPNLRARIHARIQQHPNQTMGEHAAAFDLGVVAWLNTRDGKDTT